MSQEDWTVTTGWRAYFRDRESGRFWSAADGVENGIEAKLEPVAATAPFVERRTVALTNRSDEARTIEVTFYAELVLFPMAAHVAHPAFAKLFVETALDEATGTVLAGRRPRSRGERTMWLAARLSGDGPFEVETDRARFIGRGRDLAAPAALVGDAPLSGTVGNVLDPVIALRAALRLEAGASASFEVVTAVGDTRQTALAVLPPVPAGARRELRRPAPLKSAAASFITDTGLLFDNGYGGFTPDGREYVIRIEGAHRPPMPWVNVIANDRSGFIASEVGAGSTWSENSRQNRLSPWSNDPIVDPRGETLFVRDELAGIAWSAFPGGAGEPGAFEARHGFGYSRWTHAERGVEQEIVAFVPRTDPVKVTIVRLRNTRESPRDLSLIAAQELVLGASTEETAGAIATETDAETGVVLARNPTREDLPENVAFASAVAENARLRHGVDRSRPTTRLVQQVWFTLPPGETFECALVFGEGASADEAREIVLRYREPGAAARALDDAKAFWTELVGAIRVETPSRELDLMLNGWLLYQVLSCRIRGRSAFYQAGGAFGFRDQLQDSAGLVYTRPDLVRAQIVLHSSRQFVEGDVQHWWHPPGGRGTRTRCSDDLVWLPYLASFYVATTGDASLLDERTGFLRANVLGPGEDEAYLQPAAAGESATVYDHCCRALDRALAVGANGLPLIGTCDWNDGLNRVGREGRGESVWLAFFLHATLAAFEPICVVRGEQDRADRYAAHRAKFRAAIEATAWDGEWYRRATYDDGTWLGSSSAAECRIDALAQSWAVISKAARPDRAEQAMDSAERELVDERAGLIRLLTPPFDRAPEDPGYIKGYVPGIRENGGQYTHGALWVVRATAELGRRDRAAKLLEMLTPVAHARDRAAADVYKVEPYVVAADVYAAEPHVGRGGWTWYTGSAAWMYRVALESVLGLTIEGGRTLVVKPCIPDAWPGFRIDYRRPGGEARYEIVVENESGCAVAPIAVTIDDQPGEIRDGTARIPIAGDAAKHRVVITLGPAG